MTLLLDRGSRKYCRDSALAQRLLQDHASYPRHHAEAKGAGGVGWPSLRHHFLWLRYRDRLPAEHRFRFGVEQDPTRHLQEFELLSVPTRSGSTRSALHQLAETRKEQPRRLRQPHITRGVFAVVRW